MKLYRAIDVWRRLDGGRAVRYRCFEVLPDGGFCVQSADFYGGERRDDHAAMLDRQHVELLLEQAPDDRVRTHPTLEAAIEQHDKEFDWDAIREKGWRRAGN
jgi:hypothetical protein